mmetsp:Transcript_54789/g.168856  ORF Transcript_54789/g.168856 Transcript_54789/m.168856 type:complete len:204 (-) Transcript_54789:1745-2356(-)
MRKGSRCLRISSSVPFTHCALRTREPLRSEKPKASASSGGSDAPGSRTVPFRELEARLLRLRPCADAGGDSDRPSEPPSASNRCGNRTFTASSKSRRNTSKPVRFTSVFTATFDISTGAGGVASSPRTSGGGQSDTASGASSSTPTRLGRRLPESRLDARVARDRPPCRDAVRGVADPLAERRDFRSFRSMSISTAWTLASAV